MLDAVIFLLHGSSYESVLRRSTCYGIDYGKQPNFKLTKSSPNSYKSVCVSKLFLILKNLL